MLAQFTKLRLGLNLRGVLRENPSALLNIALFCLALGARLLPTPRTIDDAFITFRYARNLLAGAGFVFNPGEHVLGTTTPLYALTLALFAGLTRTTDYPTLAYLLNALADALTCLVLVRLGEKLSGQRAVGLAVSALWAIAPMSVTFAVGGMETSVFILLLTLTADLHLSGRSRWAALTAALLLLTRPDGLIFIGPLWLDWIARPIITTLRSPTERSVTTIVRRLPWVEGAIFLGALAPWVVFATGYFGSPLPHSIIAKSLAYRLPPGAGFVRLLQHYSTPFFEQNFFASTPALVTFLILYLVSSILGGWRATRLNSRAWPLAVYPAFYFLTFSIANPLIFRWYLAPPLPFYFLLILGGLTQLLTDALAALKRPTWLPLALAWPTLFFGWLSLAEWTLQPDHGPQRPAPTMAWHQLELYYTAVGRDLAAQGVGPPTTLAAGDVGALGYYSNAHILDTVGLMSPEASAYYPLDPALYVINYAVPPQLILDHQPDYVVLLEVYGRNGLFKDERFLAEYQHLPQLEIATDIYGSQGLWVWRKVEGTP